MLLLITILNRLSYQLVYILKLVDKVYQLVHTCILILKLVNKVLDLCQVTSISNVHSKTIGKIKGISI